VVLRIQRRRSFSALGRHCRRNSRGLRAAQPLPQGGAQIRPTPYSHAQNRPTSACGCAPPCFLIPSATSLA
jgi:hypothetical protein